MRKADLVLAASSALLLIWAGGAQFGGPDGPEGPDNTRVTIQAQIKKDGNLIQNEAVDVQGALFDAPTGGNFIGSAPFVAVQTDGGGVFTAILDFGMLQLSDTKPLYLSLGVRHPAGQGSFSNIFPRVEATSTLRATISDKSIQAITSDEVTTPSPAIYQHPVTAQNITPLIDWKNVNVGGKVVRFTSGDGTAIDANSADGTAIKATAPNGTGVDAQTTDGTAVSGTATGGGTAGYWVAAGPDAHAWTVEVLDPNNPNPGGTVLYNGLGAAWKIQLDNSANQNDAIDAETNGAGSAVKGTATNGGTGASFDASGGGKALDVQANDISSSAATFTDSTGNQVFVLDATISKALCGVVNSDDKGVIDAVINNANNNQHAFSASTNGIGDAVNAAALGSGNAIRALADPNATAAKFECYSLDQCDNASILPALGQSPYVSVVNVESSSRGGIQVNFYKEDGTAVALDVNNAGMGSGFNLNNTGTGTGINVNSAFGSAIVASCSGDSIASIVSANGPNTIAGMYEGFNGLDSTQFYVPLVQKNFFSNVTSSDFGAGKFAIQNAGNNETAVSISTIGGGDALNCSTTGAGNALSVDGKSSFNGDPTINGNMNISGMGSWNGALTINSNKPSAGVLTAFNTNATGFGALLYNQFGGAGSLSSSINGYGAYNDASGPAGIGNFNVVDLGRALLAQILGASNSQPVAQFQHNGLGSVLALLSNNSAAASSSTLLAQSNGSNSVLTVQNNSLTGSTNPVARVQNSSTRTSLYTLNSNGSSSALALDVDGHGLVRKNLNVLLVLTAGTKPFKIDHPLDPQNKYLYHTAVESPDMMNVYNGNVVTDAGGYATVALPEWFEALNRDFRYQLTVIGQFAQAIVAEEVRNNAFVIRTDRPNVKVSWQVTGIRQDAFANRYRVPVEEDKAAEDRGRYLHPAAFGAPDEFGIGYEARQAAAAAEDVPPALPEVEEIMLPDGTVIRAPRPSGAESE